MDNDRYMPINRRVEQQVHRLKRFAIREQIPRGIPSDGDYIKHELVGALIKDGLGKTFVPYTEQDYTMSLTVPASWFDHLKTHLPEHMKFGWLKPEFKVLIKTVKAPLEININMYKLVLVNNLGAQHYVDYVNDFEDLRIAVYPLMYPKD